MQYKSNVHTYHIKRIKDTRQIIEQSIKEYREKRHNDLVKFQRNVNFKYHNIMKLISDNQIERLEILKNEKERFEKIKLDFEGGKITPVEALEVIPREVLYTNTLTN